MDYGLKQETLRLLNQRSEARNGIQFNEAGKYWVINTKPIGKPRMTRRDQWAKRPVVQRYWEMKDILKKQIGEDLQSQRLLLYYLFQLPKSWSKKRKEAALGKPKLTRPDLDNLVKGTLDALYLEDSVVYEIQAIKLWWDHSAIIIQEIE